MDASGSYFFLTKKGCNVVCFFFFVHKHHGSLMTYVKRKFRFTAVWNQMHFHYSQLVNLYKHILPEHILNKVFKAWLQFLAHAELIKFNPSILRSTQTSRWRQVHCIFLLYKGGHTCCSPWWTCTPFLQHVARSTCHSKHWTWRYTDQLLIPNSLPVLSMGT